MSVCAFVCICYESDRARQKYQMGIWFYVGQRCCVVPAILFEFILIQNGNIYFDTLAYNMHQS